MAYVHFITNDGNRYIDRYSYNYLVRSNGTYFNKISDYREYFYNTPISVSFNLYSLFYDETVREDLTPYLLEGGQLTINNGNGLRRKLNVEIINQKNWMPSPACGFLWKGAKFKLEICVKSASAECVYPAGVFLLNEFEMPHNQIDNKISIEMVDKFGGLDGTVGGKIVEALHISRGSNIKQVILGLLESERTPGERYEIKTVLFPAEFEEAKTPFTITKSADANSSIGEVIKELSEIINQNVYYDVYGRMCFSEQSENMLTNMKPVMWEYSDDDYWYESPSLRVQMQAVENVIIVEGANINGSIVDVTVKNTNPKSPTNITIFEPTPCRIVDENIADHLSAIARANYELFKRSLIPLAVDFNSMIIPMLDVDEVISITDKYYHLKGTRFLINSISIPISSISKMKMSVTNLEEVALNV